MRSVRDSLPGRLAAALDAPQGWASRATVLGVVGLIYLSVVLLVVEVRAPAWASAQAWLLVPLRHLVVAVFAIELAVRLAGYRQPFRYLCSFHGVIDVLAVAPAVIVPMFGGAGWVVWLRAARLFRLVKLVRWTRQQNVLAGVAGRVLPAAGMAIAAKALVLVLETYEGWPHLGGLDILVGGTGFAVALLLGTKLSIAQSRLYDVEDALCRIVGGLRDIPADIAAGHRRELFRHLDAILHSPSAAKAARLRQHMQTFEEELEAAKVGGPATAGLHRDVEFVVHRSMSRMQPAYDMFLKHATVAYTAAVILLVPGLAGLVATALVVYVLGGMYVVVDAMDRAFDPNEDLIRPDLAPLRHALS